MDDQPIEWQEMPPEPEFDESGQKPRATSLRATKRMLSLMAIGGVAGTLIRVEVSQLIVASSSSYPWATFLVNMVGAFLLGAILVGLVEHRHRPPSLQPLLATGFCGSLTTFSTLVFQADDLARNHHWSLAILYVLTSVVAGLFCAASGMWLMHQHDNRMTQP